MPEYSSSFIRALHKDSKNHGIQTLFEKECICSPTFHLIPYLFAMMFSVQVTRKMIVLIKFLVTQT